jgi:hypothetical protein
VLHALLPAAVGRPRHFRQPRARHRRFSRGLENACAEHLQAISLTGKRRPDHSTIGDFRKNHSTVGYTVQAAVGAKHYLIALIEEYRQRYANLPNGESAQLEQIIGRRDQSTNSCQPITRSNP